MNETAPAGKERVTFLRYAAYFYRFYVLYAVYHHLLCLAEALRLGDSSQRSMTSHITKE
jgi:hypothetical protein